MGSEKNPGNQDTSTDTGAECLCAAFKDMFEGMREACRGHNAPFDCWSMMKRMMDDQIEKSRNG